MYNLIRSEFYKLRYGNTYRGLILFAIFCVICTIIQSFNAAEVDFRLIYGNFYGRGYGFIANIFSDPNNLKGIEYFQSSLIWTPVLMIGLMYLISALTCDEYINGTIKNTLSYGNKRSLVYISKLATISIGIVIILVGTQFLTLLIGTLINGWGSDFELKSLIEIIRLSLTISVVFLSIASIFMVVAIIIKNKALLITLNIVALIAPTFMIENGVPIEVLNYNPIFMLYDICSKMPSLETINRIVPTCIIISIISSIIGVYIMNKQDIK